MVGVETRRRLAALCLVLLVAVAGCSGLGSHDGIDAGAQDEYPELFASITESTDNETADALAAVVTDENGELTDDGERLLDTLRAVDELGTQQRDAVVRSVTVRDDIDSDILDSLDDILASPDPFAAEVLEDGLEDTAGDGLFDGEAAALGLDPAEPDSRVADLASQYREEGYDDDELAVLQRLTELEDFEWTQAERLDLLSDLSDGGTAADRRALEDDSGDGLLNAMADELGVDSGQERDDLAALASTLDAQALSPIGLRYLERAAVVLEDDSLSAQAAYFDLFASAQEGTVRADDLRAIEDDSDDGLLNAMERELGLDPDEPDPDIATVAQHLAREGYGDGEIQYLDRVIELREYRGHEFEYWSQAEQLGLFDEEIANGTVTDRHHWKLENNASNRLLNGMELEFGTDPEKADTSGDGYEDHLLWGPMQALGLEITPDSPNVFVEVDTAEGIDPLSDEQTEAIQDAFESEPSESVGPINVQFHVCHTEQADVSTFDDLVEYPSDVPIDEIAPDDIPDPTAEKRNVTGMGFQYLLLSDGLDAGNVQGFAPSRLFMDVGQINSFAVVDGRISSESGEMRQAAVIAHELGHTLGIGIDDYHGVDSIEVSADEYDSVMNYNHPMDEVTFSTGEPFDDYEHMANQTFGSEYQDRSALESMWDEGSVDQGVLC